MRNVNLLIRLAQQRTDERRLDLGHIGRARDEADARLAAHDRALIDESEVAATHVDNLAMFADWVSHATRKRVPLQERSAELDRTEAAAREALREAFAETKRLELARDTAMREVRRNFARRTDVRADEQVTLRQMADAD